MNNIQRERAFITADYLDIIQTLISEKQQLTITKLIILSYLIKNFNYGEQIIPKQTKNNVSSLFLSLMENDKESFLNDLEIIFICLNILKQNGKINIDYQIIKNIDCSICLRTSDFREQLYKSICECSDNNILREVFNYV
ncbi:MAG: hypothetical protein MSH22_00330 [Spirochaetia bacterium]|nr:hypothetical protein [Spirochaetia bacterium]